VRPCGGGLAVAVCQLLGSQHIVTAGVVRTKPLRHGQLSALVTLYAVDVIRFEPAEMNGIS